MRYTLSTSAEATFPRPGFVRLRGTPAPIPIEIYRLLLEFSRGATFEEVFAAFDSEVPFERFRASLDGFVKAGILKPSPDEGGLARRLRSVWNKDIFEAPTRLALAKKALRSGRVVVIPNAFASTFAEQVHEELSASNAWHPFEYSDPKGDFHYKHHNIYDATMAYPPLLDESRSLFGCEHMKRFVAGLTGADTAGDAMVSASKYLPGEYSLPHDDGVPGRTVAFVWHLTKGWQRSWGGHFFWCRSATYLPPTFNTLILFRVSARSDHLVCPVASNAVGKRLSVNGWWYEDAARKKTKKTPPMDGVFEPPLTVSV